MTEYDFLLVDRIQKIQSINELYDLENKAYLSFSGGKDSTVLHYLIDIALPNNNIPRVYINTGIEYQDVFKFVQQMQKTDKRIVIIKPTQNIRKMLEEKGYPFKSKEHSEKVGIYQNSGMTTTVIDYLGKGKKKDFLCPEKLKYQFTPKFKLKLSKKCCNELKKKVVNKWSHENNKPITLTGIRKGEGGSRSVLNSCTVFNDKDLKKFHPLLPIKEDWMNEFIEKNNIKLCCLYYPPFNFKRTGCCGCPYNIYIQNELETMKLLLPNEYKKCELIWKPVYDEYRRIGYRLGEIKNDTLFD